MTYSSRNNVPLPSGRGTAFLKILCRRAIFFFSFIPILLATEVSADWQYLTADQLANKSSLIVVGELIGRTKIRFAGSSQLENIGVVRVDDALKGDRATKIVLLLLTPDRPKGLVSSTDVTLRDGQRGLWYLRAEGREGLFEVNRPDRFVALENARKRIQTLKGQMQ